MTTISELNIKLQERDIELQDWQQKLDQTSKALVASQQNYTQLQNAFNRQSLSLEDAKHLISQKEKQYGQL